MMGKRETAMKPSKAFEERTRPCTGHHEPLRPCGVINSISRIIRNQNAISRLFWALGEKETDTNMKTDMNSTMETGSERAERSEAREGPHHYKNIVMNMKANMNSTVNQTTFC